MSARARAAFPNALPPLVAVPPNSCRFAAPREWLRCTDKGSPLGQPASAIPRPEGRGFLPREGKMDNEPLLKAIIVAMMFLEHSGPDEVDPDSAVKCLENMSYELLQHAGPDRKKG